jgi:hypothetical protein
MPYVLDDKALLSYPQKNKEYKKSDNYRSKIVYIFSKEVERYRVLLPPVCICMVRYFDDKVTAKDLGKQESRHH